MPERVCESLLHFGAKIFVRCGLLPDPFCTLYYAYSITVNRLKPFFMVTISVPVTCFIGGSLVSKYRPTGSVFLN